MIFVLELITKDSFSLDQSNDTETSSSSCLTISTYISI